MRHRTFVPAALTALAFLAPAAPARAQWTVANADNTSSIKFGFLGQLQGEALDTANGEETSKNLFLRRARILIAGKVNANWSFFLDTDSPNLGKAAANGVKDTGDVYLQDAEVTYSHNDAFKVDAGMLLPAISRQHAQSAGSLLAVDYGPYAFVESAPLGARVGRDYGVQLRGYPGGHFEYRAGVLQGVRGTDATNSLRYFGRVVWYPFDADTGLFYTGTYLGKKQVMAIGASFDAQKDYDSYGADFFLEQPFGETGGLVVNLGYNQLDGGKLAPTLAEQQTAMVELGWHFRAAKITPFVQYSQRDFKKAALADTDALQVGAAYWINGHVANVKASYGILGTDHGKDRDQIVVQLQLFPW